MISSFFENVSVGERWASYMPQVQLIIKDKKKTYHSSLFLLVNKFKKFSSRVLVESSRTNLELTTLIIAMAALSFHILRDES